jgi:phage FluMu protein Com
MNVIKIEIRCKTCGKLHMEIEVEGRVKYDFKCKRCKNTNIGVITRKFNTTT